MGDNRDERDSSIALNRRKVMKAAGATAAGLSVASGRATAHNITEAVFCGCSQVCACGDGEIDVIVARETADGFDCERVTIDDDANTEFQFCYEESDGKVIAIEDGDGTVVCNPHDPCAGDALEECVSNCNRSGQSGGPCGNAFLRTCGESDSHPGQGNQGERGRGNRGRGNN